MTGGAGGRMTAGQMVDLVERHMRYETEGDLDAVMATLTPDVEWGTPETVFYAGADAVRGHYENSILPPGRFSTENFQGWADEASQKAVGFWDVRRPGDEASYPIMALFEFRGGLIATEKLFHDAAAPGCSRG